MNAQSPHEPLRAIVAEFERLGLRFEDGPYSDGLTSAGDREGAESYLVGWLRHLQSLKPGASFHEADPQLPTHWLPRQPSTWTRPFVALGEFDYQKPPAGPAFHVSWPPGANQEELDAFVAAARQRGFSVYGAAAEDARNQPGGRYSAIVILSAGTSGEERARFLEWADTGDRWVGTYRTGNERYDGAIFDG